MRSHLVCAITLARCFSATRALSSAAHSGDGSDNGKKGKFSTVPVWTQPTGGHHQRPDPPPLSPEEVVAKQRAEWRQRWEVQRGAMLPEPLDTSEKGMKCYGKEPNAAPFRIGVGGGTGRLTYSVDDPDNPYISRWEKIGLNSGQPGDTRETLSERRQRFYESNMRHEGSALRLRGNPSSQGPVWNMFEPPEYRQNIDGSDVYEIRDFEFRGLKKAERGDGINHFTMQEMATVLLACSMGFTLFMCFGTACGDDIEGPISHAGTKCQKRQLLDPVAIAERLADVWRKDSVK